MTVTIPQVDSSTDNWMDFWTKFNQVANAFSIKAVTVDSNSAVGAASITGSLRSNTIYLDNLTGGSFGNTQPFSITTFATFAANVAFTGSNNSLGAIGNTHATGANTSHKLVMANNTTGRLRFADLNYEIQQIDGANSGIDADLLDGQQGAWYADIPARQGYTSVDKAGDIMTGPLTVPEITANVIHASLITDNTITLGNTSVQSANTFQAQNTSPVLLDSFSVGIAGKYVVTRDLNGQRTISEVLVLAANTTSSSVTEFAILSSGANNVGPLSCNNAAGATRLWLTPDVGTTVGTPMNIKVHRTQL